MKAKLIGFEWELGRGIDLQEFYNTLHLEARTNQHYRQFDRQVYIDTVSDDYTAGLFLTIKDQKRFLTTRRAHGNVVLQMSEVTGNRRLADANFFVINNNTGRGLYFYYHQSFSLRSTQGLLRYYYDILKDSKISEDMERWQGANGKMPSRHRANVIRRSYKGTISVNAMIRGDSLDLILDELDDIDAFSFSYFRLVPRKSSFRPLADVVKRQRLHVTFDPDASKREIQQAITQAVQQGEINKGSVYGKRADGSSKSVPVTNNLDIFDEWDFDEIIGDIDFNADDLATSSIIQSMLGVIDENQGYFELEIE